MVIQISLTFDSNDGYSVIELDEGIVTELIVDINTPVLDSAPSAITVSVFDALGGDVLIFKVLGREVFRHQPNPDGSLPLVTVPLPNMRDASGNLILDPGTYTLEVVQGSKAGSAEFELLNPPAPVVEIIGEDAPPAPVAGAIQPNGTRRWVFQDLAPNGLGSWVLPMNPENMGSPAFSRNLTARPTTAREEVGGSFHVFEDAFTPVQWTFQGMCPSKEMREQLEAFFNLNRRWYLHDHRGRAWKVTFENLELTPRLTMIWNGDYTNEGHDYKATVLVMERDWTDVTP